MVDYTDSSGHSAAVRVSLCQWHELLLCVSFLIGIMIRQNAAEFQFMRDLADGPVTDSFIAAAPATAQHAHLFILHLSDTAI